MFSFLVILLLGAGEFAHAQNIPIPPIQIDINRNDNGRNNTQANPRVTERQAVEIARQRFAGSILRISLVGEGNNQRYQIRMENEGKVFTVFVNVSTGRISGGG
ncbi:MAG: hypothetical protein COB20_14890 [SAR86 cluster bacterium]|uniref:PepSY domain-containing protein n=1 Tax=SAR86 cluster bacterium TaxID=2030880 RepID=A0A2A4WW56_9GAMM|nr:MAG: hypothetical protein COB20_14890 [SAR86 cluster bacterium]